MTTNNKIAPKPKFKIGDTVVSNLRHSSGKKISVKGKVKKVTQQYGYVTYTVTDGVADDFSTRIAKKSK